MQGNLTSYKYRVQIEEFSALLFFDCVQVENSHYWDSSMKELASTNKTISNIYGVEFLQDLQKILKIYIRGFS